MPVFPSHESPDVSIVIVTARGGPRLERCLTAVSRFLPTELAVEVIVVLNAADHDVRRTVESVDGLRVVDSEVHLGFAGGTNLGVRAARGTYVHALHDDTEVTAGWLTPLVDLLAARPNAGAVGSMLIDDAGRVQAAGWVLWSDGRTSPPWLGEKPPSQSSFTEPVPVDYAPSAALLVRHDAWRAVGGFDEEFHPAYYVDADLAMTLRCSGWSVWCEPRSRVFHAKAGSTGKRFRTFVVERNRARFVAKWGSELHEYEPYDPSPRALRKARAESRLRAARLRATARSTSQIGALDAESDIDRLLREHRQLRRELAVKDEYITELEALVDAARKLRAG